MKEMWHLFFLAAEIRKRSALIQHSTSQLTPPRPSSSPGSFPYPTPQEKRAWGRGCSQTFFHIHDRFDLWVACHETCFESESKMAVPHAVLAEGWIPFTVIVVVGSPRFYLQLPYNFLRYLENISEACYVACGEKSVGRH